MEQMQGSSAHSRYVETVVRRFLNLASAGIQDHVWSQGKLDGMIGKPSGYIETLPKPLRNRIAYLGELQDQHDELEEKLHEEQVALHRKYEALWSASPQHNPRTSFLAYCTS